jgi:hypothetical protein
MDLLTAPWHPDVEDGGHELLKDSSDWADTNCPLMDWDPAVSLGVSPDGKKSFLLIRESLLPLSKAFWFLNPNLKP